MKTVNDRNTEIAGQFASVKQEIASATIAASRGGNDVTLVAVSKTFSAELIKPVLQAGHRVFGENRVQEAAEKWPLLRQSFEDVELHLIGPLQTNKTAMAVALFDCIETLDRPKLARALATELEKQGKEIELLVQVNTGDEPQKAGVSVGELPGFLSYCQQELKLLVQGLMCIPPITEDAGQHFSILSQLSAEHGLPKLSMGMSADYKVAIKHGATHVRVGTAIFGQR